jgi:hypothetical protein
MATSLSTSPQIKDDYAPIDVLMLRAIRRYGDMSPSTTDAENVNMFIDYANSVLDDVMEHPYWEKGYTIPTYKHSTESRPVPDALMLAGLLAKYAIDKTSVKAAKYEADYYKRLNQSLLRTKFGVGATFSMIPMDYTDSSQTIPGVD